MNSLIVQLDEGNLRDNVQMLYTPDETVPLYEILLWFLFTCVSATTQIRHGKFERVQLPASLEDTF
jgi:hypothetical protein